MIFYLHFFQYSMLSFSTLRLFISNPLRLFISNPPSTMVACYRKKRRDP